MEGDDANGLSSGWDAISMQSLYNVIEQAEEAVEDSLYAPSLLFSLIILSDCQQ